MSGLYEEKSKKKQQISTQEQRQEQNTSSRIMPVPAENIKVTGKEELAVPIPREAAEKSITGRFKGLFGFRRSLRATNDDNDGLRPDANDIPAQQPLVDLTADQRRGASGRANEAGWVKLGFSIQSVMESKEYTEAAEETKKLIRDLHAVTAPGVAEADRIRVETEAYGKLYALSERMQYIENLKGKDEGETAATQWGLYEELKAMYKDPEILIRKS